MEKAKAVREMALRKRNVEEDAMQDQENKRPRVEGCLTMPIPDLQTVMPGMNYYAIFNLQTVIPG